MSPFLQCLNDSIKLLVISGVLHFNFIQLLTEVCYRPVFLTQDCPDCKSTCIAFHLKCFSEIWQHQNWSFSNLYYAFHIMHFSQFKIFNSWEFGTKIMPLYMIIYHYLACILQFSATNYLDVILQLIPCVAHLILQPLKFYVSNLIST
jgi:hypothetical protein